MKWFVLFACCVHLAVSLPQGYNYKEPGPALPVIDANVGGGFKPFLNGGGVPCNHGPNAAALVQQQSTGRIINHQQGPSNVLLAGGGPDSQAVTVNSHIVVGDGGGQSQVYREGHGYSEQNRIRPSHIPLPQGPSLPPPGPAQAFVQTAQQQFSSSHSFNNINNGAIINGIGKVPPPSQAISGGYQYVGGFGSGKFSNGGGFSGGAGFGGPIRGPSFGGAAINPNFIAGGSRPIGGGGGVGIGIGSGFSTGGGFAAGGQQNFGGSVYQGSGSKFQNVVGIQGGGGGGGGFGGPINTGVNVGSFGQSSNFAANGILNGALGNVIRETFANAPLDPTIEKHIYVHVPPEDLEENEVRQPVHLPEVPTKKHYKIIFIKAPSVSSQANYAQLLNAGVSEEKTIVYVLVKKPDEQQSFSQIQQTLKPSKPEVYFIKYRTRKEEGPSGGFIGSGPGISVDGGLGSGQFAGSDIDGGVDVRGNGAASGIESVSSDSGSSSGVSIGESGPGHAVYGVPNVK